jgi:hypothetical protein
LTAAPARGKRTSARAACAALALLAAGCGFGEGESSGGEATLTVTRDYGAEEVLAATVDNPASSDTVLRILDREADIETQYGGGFVSSIDGISNGVREGRSIDWFFYVDGVESPIGSAEVEVEADARIWWDHHDWTDVMRVPAVVGSWPAPFAGGEPATVTCADPDSEACAEATERIEAAGDVAAGGEEGPLVLVGSWEELAGERGAAPLGGPPARSGVFARFEEAGGAWELATYDQELSEVDRLGSGSGLVAALEGSGEYPTWVVTGTDEEGAEAAAAALDEASLADRFAAAIPAGGDATRLPAP